MNILEIENVIRFLNSDTHQSIGFDSEPCWFRVESDGFTILIRFFGVIVWNSQYDMREDYEDGCKEPLDSYLRREASDIISRLKGVDWS